MGTNYYISCKCCGNKKKHIGKQNTDRNFLSNIRKEEFIQKLELKENEVIQNEYGEVLTKEQLLKDVTDDWELYEGGKHLDFPYEWC